MQIPILGMEGSEDDQELYLILAYHWNNYSIRGIESFPEYEYRSIKEIPLDIVDRWNIKDYMENTSLPLTFVMFRYNDKYEDAVAINGLCLRGEMIPRDCRNYSTISLHEAAINCGATEVDELLQQLPWVTTQDDTYTYKR